MKSAWELALERTGGALKELPADQKDKIAEIDKRYKAKVAEAELANRQRLSKAANVEEISQIKEDLVTELASLRSKMERDKDQIRNV